tara:strand:- start:34 stop:738 length:705 start_codon:yes stop_codon:yes gene_type:complete
MRMKVSFSDIGFQCCTAESKTQDALVPQNEIGLLYDGKAWFYDVWAFLTESKAGKRALELAGVKDGQFILEVAVGTGRMFFKMGKKNPNGRNIGIDISIGMLTKAKTKMLKQTHNNYSLIIGSAFDLNIEDSSVDILMNNYMFDLIPFDQMDRIIVQFRRVLKPDGKLVLVNMTKPERFGAGLYEIVYHLSPTFMGGCRGVQMTDLLTRHGFKIETREYVQQMLFPSEVILATK